MDTETSRRLKREYFENRIRSAHPLELIVMLYDAAIDNLTAAIGYLQTQDRLARSRAVTRAQEAVHELVVSLDHSVNAAFTHNLAGLYRFCLDRMAAGHATQSEQAFEEARSVLSTLAVAWREIAKETCQPAPAVEAAVEANDTEPFAQAAQSKMVPMNPYAGYGASAAAGSRDWSC